MTQHPDRQERLNSETESGVPRMTDEELALQAAAGSHSSFETLVFRYGSRLFLFLRSRIPTVQDAEDLAQETFIKAYNNIHRYDSQWKFSTWLYTIASRSAIGFYRTHGRKSAVFVETTEASANYDSPDPSVANNPHDSLQQTEDQEALWRTARSLKPEQYEALWLRYAEELPVRDIATVMGKSLIHTRVLLHRGRLTLTKLCGKPELAAQTAFAPVSVNGE